MTALPPVAQRMDRIRPFHVMALLARARALEAAGRDIVHMEIGEPDFSTPAPIVEAAVRAMRAGKTHYTPALGLPALREAIAAHYDQQFGVSVDPARIIVTPGASGALQLVTGVLVEPGRKMLLTDPGYPCNRHFVEMMGGEPVSMPVDALSHFHPTAYQVEKYWDESTCGVLIASPSNPTGTCIDQSVLREIMRLAAARHGVVIVDEIYQNLVYGQPAQTSLSIDDGHFVINSFSKFFGMTGWRLGWIVAPEQYIDALDRLAQNIYLAAPTTAQYAALAAFDAETLEILEARRDVFAQRRDFLLPALEAVGFDVPVRPEGAFYIYAASNRFASDSFELTTRLLEEAGVAVTPGLDFGDFRSDAFVRFAYTTDIDRLAEGVARLERYLQ